MSYLLALLVMLLPYMAWARPADDAITPVIENTAAAQDASSDAMLIEKAKVQEDKNKTKAESDKKDKALCADLRADEALKASTQETCDAQIKKINADGKGELSDSCKLAAKCVSLEPVTLKTSEPLKEQPIAKNETQREGSKTAVADAAKASPSQGDIRIGGEMADATPDTAQGLLQPAVARTEPASLPADDQGLTLRQNAKPPVTKAAKTDALQAIPASTGDAERDMASAQGTLGKNGVVDTSGFDPLSTVLGGQGRYGNRGFGKQKHPIYGDVRMHAGQDIPAKSGTPVRAPADGVVVRSEYSGKSSTSGYGFIVDLKHADGTVTRYAHLHAGIARPQVGTVLKKGDMIGGVGSTGGSTGAHLHYEVRPKGGEPIDPMSPQGLSLMASLGGTPLSAQQIATLQASTPRQSFSSSGSGSAATYTNASYSGGGTQLGGAVYPAQFQYNNAMLGTPTMMGGGMMGGMGMTGQGMQVGAQGMPAMLQASVTPLPVLYFSEAAMKEFNATGQLPFNERQNGQLATDCTNQESTSANEELLRPECKKNVEDILEINMV